MGILGEILGGGLGKLAKDVVGTFKLPPEKQAEFERLLSEHEHEIRMKEYELQVKAMEAESRAIEQASMNIRAEAQSGDKYTSRARPTFMYLFYVVIAFNMIIVPLSQMIGGYGLQNVKLIDVPEWFYELFLYGYLGYVGARAFEKSKWGRK